MVTCCPVILECCPAALPYDPGMLSGCHECRLLCVHVARCPGYYMSCYRLPGYGVPAHDPGSGCRYRMRCHVSRLKHAACGIRYYVKPARRVSTHNTTVLTHVNLFHIMQKKRPKILTIAKTFTHMWIHISSVLKSLLSPKTSP